MGNENDNIDVRTACIAANEYYVSLRDAGFTRWEALWLVLGVITGGCQPPKGDGDE